MKIIAVVVTYNGAQWIDRCFGSLRASSLPLHTVVVDNGSSDGTPDLIASRFKDVEIIRAKRNLGFGQANNVGLRMALDRGVDHVFLLNQDAWVLPNTLERLVAAMGSAPDIGVLSPLHMNGTGEALDTYFAECLGPKRCPGFLSDLALARVKDGPYALAFVNAAAWLLTRRCLTTVGGFSPSFFHYGEDDNYVARMRYHGFRIAMLPAARIHHDRAERGANPFFDDKPLLRARRTLLTYADPNSEQNLSVDRREWRIKMVQGLIFARMKEYRDARERLRILRDPAIKAAMADRAISRIPGPSFL